MLALIFSRNVRTSKLGLTLSERMASDVDLDDYIRDCRVDDKRKISKLYIKKRMNIFITFKLDVFTTRS